MSVIVMGMKYMPCEGDDQVKILTVVTADIAFRAVGLASLVACSWTGHRSVTDFCEPLLP